MKYKTPQPCWYRPRRLRNCQLHTGYTTVKKTMQRQDLRKCLCHHRKRQSPQCPHRSQTHNRRRFSNTLSIKLERTHTETKPRRRSSQQPQKVPPAPIATKSIGNVSRRVSFLAETRSFNICNSAIIKLGTTGSNNLNLNYTYIRSKLPSGSSKNLSLFRNKPNNHISPFSAIQVPQNGIGHTVDGHAHQKTETATSRSNENESPSAACRSNAGSLAVGRSLQEAQGPTHLHHPQSNASSGNKVSPSNGSSKTATLF